jgi:hypothetical protein
LDLGLNFAVSAGDGHVPLRAPITQTALQSRM